MDSDVNNPRKHWPLEALRRLDGNRGRGLVFFRPLKATSSALLNLLFMVRRI